ncbi:MAG: sulfate adenylyltransferase subunit 1 [Patescibacteria group bacterium]|nr:sulfate adenylyltransferase subunit 1 [Patescibacteria group bacterium]
MYSRRPVLVVRKLGRFSFIGVPLTSQLKSGTWYFNLNIKDEKNSIILSQVRHFDYRRMDKILSKIALSDLNSIKIALARLIKPE